MRYKQHHINLMFIYHKVPKGVEGAKYIYCVRDPSKILGFLISQISFSLFLIILHNKSQSYLIFM